MRPISLAPPAIRTLWPLVGLALALSACQPTQPAVETGAEPAAAAVQANDTTPAAAPEVEDAASSEAAAPEATNVAAGVAMLDDMTMVGPASFIDGYEPINADGTINAVVEVPAGTTAKWEVHGDDGTMHWDVKDGKPRLVEYLGYPVNYGMVPQTELAESMGGDGDPLDMLLLGEALPRGTVLPVKVIALAKFTDTGERDDKLIVVRAGTPFAALGDLSDLEASFPGVTDIIATWFLNYKGPGVFESQGFGDAAEAKALLNATIEAYANPEAAEGEAEDAEAPAEEPAAAEATATP